MMKLLVLLVVMSLTIGACQKNENATPDAAKVNVTIASPQAGQTFKSGDTVYIKSNVTYGSELHGYEVKIEDTATGFILYDEAQHLHDDHFVIDDKWVGLVNTTTNLRLTIIADIDHTGDDARKVIYFQITP